MLFHYSKEFYEPLALVSVRGCSEQWSDGCARSRLVASSSIAPGSGQSFHRRSGRAVARRSGHTIGQVFVGSVAIPIGNQTQLILYDKELAAHDNVTPHPDAGPTMIGNTIPANLMRPPAFPYWVAQLNTLAVGHAQNGWAGQEAAHPTSLGFQAAEQSGAFRQSGKRNCQSCR